MYWLILGKAPGGWQRQPSKRLDSCRRRKNVHSLERHGKKFAFARRSSQYSTSWFKFIILLKLAISLKRNSATIPNPKQYYKRQHLFKVCSQEARVTPINLSAVRFLMILRQNCCSRIDISNFSREFSLKLELQKHSFASVLQNRCF